MLCLYNYTHVLTGKQRQMKAVRRRMWEPCLLFSCSSHWVHYCLSPCLVANFQKRYWGHHSLLLCRKQPWSIWTLDHFCMPLDHSTVFTDKHLQVCKHSPTHYIITEERGSKHPLQYKGIVNKLREKGRNIQRHPPFLACCIWFLSWNSLNICPPLQKSRAKAWLLSALLANEVRNLPLSPPGNWII